MGKMHVNDEVASLQAQLNFHRSLMSVCVIIIIFIYSRNFITKMLFLKVVTTT